MSTSAAYPQPVPVNPQVGVDNWHFSGTTVPTNHTALEMVSGSSPKLVVRACTTANSANYVGLYNVKFGNVHLYNQPSDKACVPVVGGTDWALYSGSDAGFNADLITAATGALTVASGTASANVVARTLRPATHGDLVPVQVLSRPQPAVA